MSRAVSADRAFGWGFGFRDLGCKLSQAFPALSRGGTGLETKVRQAARSRGASNAIKTKLRFLQ